MARSNAQKRAASSASSKATPPTTTSSSSSNSSSSNIPHPFEPAPARLQAWLAATLAPDRLYLTHLDLNPHALKRQVFAVPVVLNLLFAAALVWRVWYVAPWYAQLARQVWMLRSSAAWGALLDNGTGSGKGSGSSVSRTLWRLLKQELRNCLTVALDYLLLLVVAPWPWSFFLEQPGNPVAWRWALGGVRARELVVRVSRGWDVADLMHGRARQASESPFFVTRVFPAVQMARISKTGYLLMDKDWDLDFWAMVQGEREMDEAARLARSGAADANANSDTAGLAARKEVEDALNGKMFAFWKPSASSPASAGRWVMWDYRRDLYDAERKVTSTSELEQRPAQRDGRGAAVSDGRRAIERFEAKLAEMGKEELFFKWVELIHYESSRPGGFTKQRQIEAGAKIKLLFEQYEVDFEQFERDCGIVDGQLVD